MLRIACRLSRSLFSTTPIPTPVTVPLSPPAPLTAPLHTPVATPVSPSLVTPPPLTLDMSNAA